MHFKRSSILIVYRFTTTRPQSTGWLQKKKKKVWSVHIFYKKTAENNHLVLGYSKSLCLPSQTFLDTDILKMEVPL